MEFEEGKKHKRWSKKATKKWNRAHKASERYNKRIDKKVEKVKERKLKKLSKTHGHSSPKDVEKDANRWELIKASDIIGDKDIRKEIESRKKNVRKKSNVDKKWEKVEKHKAKEPDYKAKHGGSVGKSIKTYSNGGYVEGE